MSVEVGGFTFQNLDAAAEVAALKGLVESAPYNAMDDDDQVARTVLTKTLVDPSPWPQIPDPAKFNVDYLLGFLTTQDAAALTKIPEDSLDRVGERIEEGDVAGVVRAAAVWEAKAYITNATRTALVAEATATVNDPNAAKVAGDSPVSTAIGRQPAALTGLEVAKAKELG